MKFMKLFTPLCTAAALSLANPGLSAEAVVDGLSLDKRVSGVEFYVKPGTSLSQYQAYGLEPCAVSFKKNWLRDQNHSRPNLSSRVTQKDADRIKEKLSESCDAMVLAALQKEPAHKLVDQADKDSATLVLRPTVINLDVHAPDVQSATRTRSFTTSAGEMTLSLDIVDAATNETVARVYDRKKAHDNGRLELTNSVTNKFESDRTMRYWSKKLREALDS